MQQSPQDRQNYEEKIILQALGSPIPRYELDYMKNNPAMRCEPYPRYLQTYLSKHSAFQDCAFKMGQILVKI